MKLNKVRLGLKVNVWSLEDGRGILRNGELVFSLRSHAGYSSTFCHSDVDDLARKVVSLLNLSEARP